MSVPEGSKGGDSRMEVLPSFSAWFSDLIGSAPAACTSAAPLQPQASMMAPSSTNAVPPGVTRCQAAHSPNLYSGSPSTSNEATPSTSSPAGADRAARPEPALRTSSRTSSQEARARRRQIVRPSTGRRYSPFYSDAPRNTWGLAKAGFAARNILTSEAIKWTPQLPATAPLPKLDLADLTASAPLQTPSLEAHSGEWGRGGANPGSSGQVEQQPGGLKRARPLPELVIDVPAPGRSVLSQAVTCAPPSSAGTPKRARLTPRGTQGGAGSGWEAAPGEAWESEATSPLRRISTAELFPPSPFPVPPPELSPQLGRVPISDLFPPSPHEMLLTLLASPQAQQSPRVQRSQEGPKEDGGELYTSASPPPPSPQAEVSSMERSVSALLVEQLTADAVNLASGKGVHLSDADVASFQTLFAQGRARCNRQDTSQPTPPPPTTQMPPPKKRTSGRRKKSPPRKPVEVLPEDEDPDNEDWETDVVKTVHVACEPPQPQTVLDLSGVSPPVQFTFPESPARGAAGLQAAAGEVKSHVEEWGEIDPLWLQDAAELLDL